MYPVFLSIYTVKMKEMKKFITRLMVVMMWLSNLITPFTYAFEDWESFVTEESSVSEDSASDSSDEADSSYDEDDSWDEESSDQDESW